MNLKGLIRKAKEDSEGSAAKAADKPSQDSSFSFDLSGLLSQVSNEQLSVIDGLPTVMLAKEWLPEHAEALIIEHLRARKDDFVQLRGKRTARYGGDAGQKPFCPELLQPWLQQLCAKVAASTPDGSPEPNHVLVNHYQPGDGIMPHTDGPAYLPRAAILSLGSATVFDFWTDHAHTASGRPPTLSVLLPPRSLLFFTDQAYSSHLHGIASRRFDELEGVANWTPEVRDSFAGSGRWTSQLETTSLRREERYSLTIRHVPSEVTEAAGP
ncbi:unnamed protein product [Polarella glacialis]|uniref:Fe2OG dioxygenase domain-containing protein n=1 Tax=Polarella glacialis TaxID=89957 RepID=A0A813JSH0_POLGL|nr:unnamed protein product [Polarella glacialis]